MTPNFCRSSSELRPNSHMLPSWTFGRIVRPNFGVCQTSAHLYFIPHICNTFRWTWWDWSLNLRSISSFSASTLGWVVWPTETIPSMTYNVFGGTLSLALLQFYADAIAKTCGTLCVVRWEMCSVILTWWYWEYRLRRLSHHQNPIHLALDGRWSVTAQILADSSSIHAREVAARNAQRWLWRWVLWSWKNVYIS